MSLVPSIRPTTTHSALEHKKNLSESIATKKKRKSIDNEGRQRRRVLMCEKLVSFSMSEPLSDRNSFWASSTKMAKVMTRNAVSTVAVLSCRNILPAIATFLVLLVALSTLASELLKFLLSRLDNAWYDGKQSDDSGCGKMLLVKNFFVSFFLQTQPWNVVKDKKVFSRTIRLIFVV